jgi:AcrR family transcriptional regulator
MFLRGVAATTTDDVQRAAGASASQIYHHFNHKTGSGTSLLFRRTQC